MLSIFRRKQAGVTEFNNGRQFHIQQRYVEAERLFRESAQQREKALGAEHEKTLESKDWLVQMLHHQQKYEEAERLLRELVHQRGKTLGLRHEDTLESEEWLALTLRDQRKYKEAEWLLRELVYERGKTLGVEHEDTLESKYWLALTLHDQQKYEEAERLFRESAQQRGKTLGVEHKNTLGSKYWLALTLRDQQKYEEAERLLRELVHQLGKTLGVEHEKTLESKRFLHQVRLALTSAPSIAGSSSTVPSRLSDFFPADRQHKASYTDAEISQISLLLQQVSPQWSKIARTYIVLRNIDCLGLIDTFIDAGFSDYWFPVTEKSLPQFLRPSQRSNFIAAQHLIMTKSMDLERGPSGRHCRFQRDDPLPFEVKAVLGSGGFGQVDRVLSSISLREYALKRVRRGTAFGVRKEHVTQFIAEIQVLKRLRHRHIVEFVGSYTDPKYIGLIMSPIAEMDLGKYLQQAKTTQHGELRTFFGCLATGLAFLHQAEVRHKDIKPGNILVHRGSVLFTDFGLSFDFADAEGSTSAGMANGMTPKYCAPEVAMLEPRNTSSDIWSLGVVFLEMIVVLKSRTVEDMYGFLREHGSEQALVRTNPKAVEGLVQELWNTGYSSDNIALGWVHDMLVTSAKRRPTAGTLLARIIAACKSGDTVASFCGICCMSADDDVSDECDECDEF